MTVGHKVLRHIRGAFCWSDVLAYASSRELTAGSLPADHSELLICVVFHRNPNIVTRQGVTWNSLCNDFCALCSFYPILLLIFVRIPVWICVMSFVLGSSPHRRKHLRVLLIIKFANYLLAEIFWICKLCHLSGLVSIMCPDLSPVPSAK